jgi:hypothetical protein
VDAEDIVDSLKALWNLPYDLKTTRVTAPARAPFLENKGKGKSKDKGKDKDKSKGKGRGGGKGKDKKQEF